MLTAVATDKTGATSRSSSATVTVTAPAPDLPAPWQSGDIGLGRRFAGVWVFDDLLAKRPAVQRGYKVPKDAGEIPMP